MVAMANQDDGVIFAGVLHRLHMDLSYQRTGGIDHAQVATLAGLSDFGRDTVGTVDDSLPLRHFLHAIHEDSALFREFIHHVAVVNDLLADVDGPSEGLQRNTHDINGAHYPRAEPSWLQ